MEWSDDGAAGQAGERLWADGASAVPASWCRDWLFERSPIGAAWLDPAGVILSSNAAFARLFATGPAPLAGCAFVDFLARNDRERVAELLSKLVMRTGRTARLDQIRTRHGRPGDPPLVLFATPLGADSDEAAVVLQVLQTQDRAVDTGELLQQQKMQAVGQLAGGIAHDFNNLLTAMLGFCDLLLIRHGRDDPSHEEIAQIRGNALRASDLVRQLLAFSRKQALQPMQIDVGRALDDVAVMLRRLLGPHIELIIDHDPDAGCITADPGQFDQVIINLAVNARDAMPAGGQLTIRTVRVTLTEPVAAGGTGMPPGDYLRIEVSDTGVGIASEIMANIFEPFFTTKDGAAGTGLGLATVHGIVRQSGGFIFVDSALGAGTTFFLYLPRLMGRRPAEPAAPVSAADVLAAHRPTLGDATVLLVDDEDSVRVFAARGLRRIGLQVLEADSAERALDVIAAHGGRIDLLLTDVVMPGMDGYTLAHLARRDLPSLPVIAMSGYQEDVLFTSDDAAGAIHFLQKPFTLGELAAKMAAVLQRAAQAAAPDGGMRPE
jgi:two-component system cell cycle sensor histidine kinase/response regulator CckA